MVHREDVLAVYHNAVEPVNDIIQSCVIVQGIDDRNRFFFGIHRQANGL